MFTKKQGKKPLLSQTAEFSMLSALVCIREERMRELRSEEP